MIRFAVIGFTFLASTAAFAQQPMPQPQASVQEQLTSMYVGINGQLAKQLDAANAKIADLEKQIAALKAPPKPIADAGKEKPHAK